MTRSIADERFRAYEGMAGARRSSRLGLSSCLQDSRWGLEMSEGALACLRLRGDVKWFQNGSMDITVKNIPQAVYLVMKKEAKRKRRSLNAEIIQALETEAAEAERRRQLGNLRKELDRFAASLAPVGDSVPVIRRERQR